MSFQITALCEDCDEEIEAVFIQETEELNDFIAKMNDHECEDEEEEWS